MKTRAEIARDAGLAETMVSNYINRGSLPRCDIALRMARAAGVPVEWLIDDTQTWPPPAAPSLNVLERLSDSALMMEVARRHRLAVLELFAALDRAIAIDWTAAGVEAKEFHDGPVPQRLRTAINVFKDVSVKCGRAMQTYDVEFQAVLHHASLPGSDRPIADLAMKGFAYGAFSDRADVEAFRAAVHANPALRGERLSPDGESLQQSGEAYRQAMHGVHSIADIQRINAHFGRPASLAQVVDKSHLPPQQDDAK